MYRSISPPTTFGACVYGVKKSLGINKIIPKHLKQIFHYSMEECGSAASEVQYIDI